MASNEREIKRQEKQRQKDRKNKRIIWIILILVLAGLLVMKVCEIDFSSIKDTVMSTSQAQSMSSDIYPYSLESFENADLYVINDKLDILTNTSMVILNPTDAKQIYNVDHNYSNPILYSASNYICLIDQGGTRLRLDTTTGEKFEKNTTKRIITADVARNGHIAYATLSEEGKSEISVITKSTVEKQNIKVRDGYVTNIAINSNGTKLAYTTVNSKNAKLITTIHTIDIGANKKETFNQKLPISNVLKLKYNSSDNCYIIGDDGLYQLHNQKKVKEIFKQGSISTIGYCFTDTNELILNYAHYNDSQENEIAYVKSNDKIKSTIKLKKRAKSISSSSNKITVLLDNKIKVYSLTKGEEKSSISCQTDAKKAYTMSTKQFILHGQYIDTLE